MTEKLTSRTAIETDLKCPRARYLGYEIPVKLSDNSAEPDGYGLQRITKSIDLVFGGFVHQGCELILKGHSFEKALDIATANFMASFEGREFFDRDSSNDEELERSFNEHKALLEALLYAWYITEFKDIKENCQIVLVEQEIENNISLYSDMPIILQSRVDCLLLDKQTDELQTYSLKTIKQTGFFSEMMMNRDLQGYLEMWAVERWLEKMKKVSVDMQKALSIEIPKEMRETISSYFNKKIPLSISEVDRVRFCFLVKGWKDKKTNERANSFIYGYRKLGIDHNYSYAHSWIFYNPNNVSGEGRLGKGWEKFRVWEEYEGGVRKWIDDINAGMIQPEAKNPMGAIVVNPEPVIRQNFMLTLTINNVSNKEEDIMVRAKLPNAEDYFMPNHRSCTLPTECEFYDICYKHEVRENPVGSGLYQIRKNHHERVS